MNKRNGAWEKAHAQAEEMRDRLCALYEADADIDAVLNGLREWPAQYNVDNAKYDLWLHIRGQHPEACIARGTLQWAPAERGQPYYELALALVERAYTDLASGLPCTIGAYIGWPKQVADVWRCVHNDDGDEHACSQDAFAWLTSFEFLNLMDNMGWNWERHMNAVLEVAARNQAIFPFVPLIPALVWRIACVLEGEAGGMGYTGMYWVGDSMLSRRQLGQPWEEVLQAYHACANKPSVDAMAIAQRMLTHPWESAGLIFAYSERDRLRMGWPVGEQTVVVNGQTLHMGRDIGED